MAAQTKVPGPNPAGRGQREEAVAQRKAKAQARWENIENFLERYKNQYTPASSYCFRWREGGYVLLVTACLLGATFLATLSTPVAVIAALCAVYILLDTLLVNTAIVFRTGRGINPLRSALLTMIAYLNVALSFAPFWILLGSESTSTDQVMTAIYQSLRTLAMVGPDGSLPPFGKLLATVELLIGIYFLIIILSIYVSWASRGDRNGE